MKKLFLAIICCFCLAVGIAPPAEAGMISKDQEISMGRETGKQLEAQYGIVQDSAMQARVNRIGQSIVKVCGRQDLDYSFTVLNSNEVNAMACPGGFVYVFKGLLDYMPSDMELAGVLGHEVGHVVKKHTVHQIEKQLWTTLLLIAATQGEAMGLVSVAQQALMAGYSRADERAADKEGFYNSLNAGYNPYSMLIAVYKLEDLSAQQGNPGYGVFSSHPEPEARVRNVTKLTDKLNIYPRVAVTEDEKTATVKEGDWTFNISHSIGNTKARYRAYMLAGSLWVARQRGKINPNHFVVYDHGNTADIYYDDIQLLTLYNQDAAGFGSAGNYAAACANMLRDWAEIANTEPLGKSSKKIDNK